MYEAPVIPTPVMPGLAIRFTLWVVTKVQSPVQRPTGNCKALFCCQSRLWQRKQLRGAQVHFLR
jgi:hypothetical protein